MTQYTLTHLSDAALLRDLATLVARDRDRTATLLAHVAEVDVRRLYVAAGYSSMFAYCIEELRLSEDAAYKRIRAARAARQFPALFTAVAEGRLHLTAVCLIAPHLTAESLDGLIEAATHRRKSEIEGYLARRFPLLNLGARERVASLIRPIGPLAPGSGGTDQLVLGRVGDGGKEDRLTSERADDRSDEIGLGRVVDGVDPGQLALGRVLDGSNAGQLALGRVLVGSDHDQLVLGRVGEGSDRGQDDGGSGSGQPAGGPADSKEERFAPQQGSTPFAAEGTHSESMRAAEQHFLVQLTISKRVHDKLRHAQALLSHSVAPEDLAQVLERALDALIGKLESRKVGAASNPRTRLRSAAGGETGPGTKSSPAARNRYVPAHVRRAVWVRDKGQCTFVSAAGHRCTARRLLEFDHIEPVARGGKATADGLRLRCRSHNQLEAERTFGADFMSRKRREARLGRARSRAESGGHAPAEARAEAHADFRDPAGAKDPAHVSADHLAMQDRLGGRADPS